MIYQAARLWKALQNTTQHPKRPMGAAEGTTKRKTGQAMSGGRLSRYSRFISHLQYGRVTSQGSKSLTDSNFRQSNLPLSLILTSFISVGNLTRLVALKEDHLSDTFICVDFRR